MNESPVEEQPVDQTQPRGWKRHIRAEQERALQGEPGTL